MSLLVLLFASLGLALLMRGSMALARSTFQTPLDTPTPQPTATLAPAETPFLPTATPAPPAEATPTPPPTDEGPDLPTLTVAPPQPAATLAASPTVPPSPTLEATSPVPTVEPTLPPTPTTVVPVESPPPPAPPPAGPEPQGEEPAALPEPPSSGLGPTEVALLIDSLIVAGGYIWLCCGVVLVLFIPVALLWLNRRGKRRAREP
jgi:hypothetical protein